MSQVSTTALTFVDYEMSSQRRRMSIVSEQRNLYLSEDRFGQTFYQPIRLAMRAAAIAADPYAEIDKAIGDARRPGQEKAFQEVSDGFVPWLIKQRATGVSTQRAVFSEGDLDISVQPHMGLRLRDHRPRLEASADCLSRVHRAQNSHALRRQ